MNEWHLVMGTPNAYLQAPGLLRQAGEWVGKYGNNAYIVTGVKSWASAGKQLTDSFIEHGIRYRIERYRGECSYEELNRLEQLVPQEADLIVGVGAGKVLDVAKALSDRVAKPFIAVPTIAATCAAVTNLSVMYTQDGVYVDFPIFYRNTLLTLVDTEVIVKAPARYLVAGIGDTIAKWYESLQSSTGKPHNLPIIGGLQAAKLCYDTLIEHGEQALADAGHGIGSAALQKVVDAIILFSGLVGGLGERSCRSAAAHAIHNGLTALPETHRAYHGEKVAYGILVQLVLENRPEHEIRELLDFYRKVKLPYTLNMLGVEKPLTKQQMDQVVAVSLSPEGTMSSMPFPVTEQMVADAIETVESWN